MGFKGLEGKELRFRWLDYGRKKNPRLARVWRWKMGVEMWKKGAVFKAWCWLVVFRHGEG